MAEVTETLLTEKLNDGWNRKSVTENFLADAELSVTITLSEYRRLIAREATAQYEIDKANADKYERNAEILKLKDKVKEQELELFKYHAKFGALESEEE